MMRAALEIARRDVRIEMRTGEIVVTTGFFAVLMAVLSSLSLYIDDTTARQVAPGILWLCITFTGVLAMARSWSRERENDVIRALLLAPIPRASIYVGKAIGAFAFLLAVELLLVPLIGLFFHLDLLAIGPMLATIVVLGTFGFVAAGTLFSAMSVRTRARELLLSIVLFPLLAPALLAAVVATRELFAGAPLSDVLSWLRVVLAFDLVFIVSGLYLFEPLMDE